MKVFMIGGTGLIGSIAAKKLIDSGHYVTSLALPPIPKGAFIPEKMELIFKNFMQMSDDELSKLMQNSEVFIFAAGIDERIVGKPPIYEMYYNLNIKPLERLIKLAKANGIKKTIVLGSYFSYFDREWKELNLYKNNPYIRSRVDQENMVLSYADDNMKVVILELPYIFGVQPGRKPVWVFIVEQILKMKCFTFYPKGGTTMITTDQVGEIIKATCLMDTEALIPVGYYNLTWKEMINIIHNEMNIKRRILSIPKWLYKILLKFMKMKYKRKRIESGLNFDSLAEIMSRKAFIDYTYIRDYLKVNDSDIESAIKDSVRLSLEVINGAEEIIDMKSA